MDEDVTLKDLQKANLALAHRDYETICSLGNHIKDSNGVDGVSVIGQSLLTAAEKEDFGEVRKWLAELSNVLRC